MKQVHFHMVCTPLKSPISLSPPPSKYIGLWADGNALLQIPKPDAKQGLGIGWPQQETDMDKLKALFEEIKAKM